MSDTPENPFKVEKKGHVAWLILNRPDKRNAMGLDFFTLLGEHMRRFDADPAVRVVVIRAEGKSFTAGLDLVEAGAILSDSSASGRETMRQKITELQESISAIERCRKPVIAAVQGHCIGGGVDLISACDIRLATEDAVFAIRETKIGIIADVGTMQRMPAIVGDGWFRELALTGRDFTATEALQMGFVTRVCGNVDPLLETASALAGEIAANPPMTTQGVKDVIVFNRDNGVYPGLQYVAQKNAAQLPSEDLIEAVTAFMEKRDPVFKGN
jgi:Delta3,5-Delta2,4-dienoyl-CoA isomerase